MHIDYTFVTFQQPVPEQVVVKHVQAEDYFQLLVDLMIWTWDLAPLAMGALPFQALGKILYNNKLV